LGDGAAIAGEALEDLLGGLVNRSEVELEQCTEAPLSGRAIQWMGSRSGTEPLAAWTARPGRSAGADLHVCSYHLMRSCTVVA